MNQTDGDAHGCEVAEASLPHQSERVVTPAVWNCTLNSSAGVYKTKGYMYLTNSIFSRLEWWCMGQPAACPYGLGTVPASMYLFIASVVF